MKKLVLFALLSFTVLGNVSCSRDNDDVKTTETTKKNEIVGTWDFYQYKLDGVWKSMEVLKYDITLNSDGTYTTNYLGVRDAGTYTYSGDIIITKSNYYDAKHIKVKSISGGIGEVEIFDPKNSSDKAEIRLKKR